MRIIYTRTQFWFNLKAGGSVGHTLGVLKGFRRNNCEVKIISNETFLGIDDFDYIIIKPRYKAFLGEFIYNFYAKNRFKNEILKFNPDIIYHRYTGNTFFVAKIAKELKIPLILEFNSFDTWKMKHWSASRNALTRSINERILYNIVKRIENYNLKNASLIVTVSEPLKADLLKLGIPEEKILVNPNRVDPQKFNPKIITREECSKLKRSLGIGNDKVIVGFTGTFGEWHGIPQLTEAIDKILKSASSTNIHFLLMGAGKFKPEAESQIGHYENVTFTGVVPYSDIQKYLAICDILVSPHNPQVDGREFFGSPTKVFEYMAMGKGIVASNLGQIGEVLKNNHSAILVEPRNVNQLIEPILKKKDISGSPLKLWEYMACGKPVVATNTDDFRVLGEYNAGILVNPEKTEEVADAIITLLKNKELREEMGKNGRKYVVENRSWESVAREVEKVMKETVK